MTGALVSASAIFIVSGETWLRSSIMPIRFISRTIALPKGDMPFSTGSAVAESAQSLWIEWVRVM
jgi:hypothetical protein